MTTTRNTVAAALASIFAADRAMNAAERVPTGDDYNGAFALLAPFEAVAGLPFHMAADLLNVRPDYLAEAIGDAAALATPTADTLRYNPSLASDLQARSESLRAALALYEAENAPPVVEIGPDLDNVPLADILDNLDRSAPLDDRAWAAIYEAAQRIRERGDEGGDYVPEDHMTDEPRDYKLEPVTKTELESAGYSVRFRDGRRWCGWLGAMAVGAGYHESEDAAWQECEASYRRDECKCDDLGWHGEGHATACPLYGLPR